ncbi:MAG: exodeoxyribonuclease VII small subunit [Bacteroidetes bacterium]|nr:exodeoxyribonuclease VII small subunit [Bacteroidota bacterium]
MLLKKQKMNLTYSKAYTELSKLVEQIEDDKIQLDTLADKVRQAKELIEFCETRLRVIDCNINSVLTEKKSNARKKDS